MPYTSFIHPSMYQFMASNIYWDLFSATCSEEQKKELDTDSALYVLYDLPRKRTSPPKYTLLTEIDAQRTVQEHRLISTKGCTPPTRQVSLAEAFPHKPIVPRSSLTQNLVYSP